VVHDFEPDFDTYVEKSGYRVQADLGLDEVEPSGYAGLVLPGGRAPEYLRNRPKAVAIVRRLLDAEKAGHGGTLDPLASGILPIALGEATKTVAWAMDGAKTYRFAVRWGMTVIAGLYLGKIASYLVAIRGIQHGGGAYTLWLIIVVALTDIVGMIVGLQFGRTPLAPRISPSKTWEGAIAAFVAATAVGTLLGLLPQIGAPWYLGLAFSGSVSLAAQLGDLVESALKRNAQVKDSGQLIVGHGGVLDRFDSYFLAGVVGYAVLLWFGRVAA
jgi:phosphatidate cytidylyltransferase